MLGPFCSWSRDPVSGENSWVRIQPRCSWFMTNRRGRAGGSSDGRAACGRTHMYRRYGTEHSGLYSDARMHSRFEGNAVVYPSLLGLPSGAPAFRSCGLILALQFWHAAVGSSVPSPSTLKTPQPFHRPDQYISSSVKTNHWLKH